MTTKGPQTPTGDMYLRQFKVKVDNLLRIMPHVLTEVQQRELRKILLEAAARIKDKQEGTS